jgi:hypothetical protein
MDVENPTVVGRCGELEKMQFESASLVVKFRTESNATCYYSTSN